MKTLYSLLILTLLNLKANAQNFLWAYTANSTPNNEIVALKKDFLNDIYIATHYDSMGNVLNSTLEKRNSSNVILWSLNLPNGARITDVEVNALNHPVIIGYYSNDLVFGNDTLHALANTSAFLVETFEDGSLFWKVSYNPTPDEFKPVDLFIDQSNNIYFTAELNGASNGFASFHKMDSWGVPMQDEFNNNSDVRSYSHIFADNTGNVYLSGTCSNNTMFDTITAPNITYQNFLVKYDAAFNAQWLVTREYITFDHNNGLGTDGQNLYWTYIEATQTSDTHRIAKVDLSGQMLIERNSPFQQSFFPSIGLGTDSSGNSVLVASAFNKIYLHRFDNQLNLIWDDSLMAEISGFPLSVPVACYDSSFYIGSRYHADTLYFDTLSIINPYTSLFESDFFIAKWGYNNTVSTGELINKINLEIFPNPVNNKLTIKLPSELMIRITIINNTGQSIYQSWNESSGYFDINLSSLTSGLYIVRIDAKDFTLSRKIIVER